MPLYFTARMADGSFRLMNPEGQPARCIGGEYAFTSRYQAHCWAATNGFALTQAEYNGEYVA